MGVSSKVTESALVLEGSRWTSKRQLAAAAEIPTSVRSNSSKLPAA
jgi:hypothetical protein